MGKLKTFIVGVKKETERIKWPTRKDMVKYTGATLVLVLFFAGLFSLLDILFYFLGII